jgi:hypothetical protein
MRARFHLTRTHYAYLRRSWRAKPASATIPSDKLTSATSLLVASLTCVTGPRARQSATRSSSLYVSSSERSCAACNPCENRTKMETRAGQNVSFAVLIAVRGLSWQIDRKQKSSSRSILHRNGRRNARSCLSVHLNSCLQRRELLIRDNRRRFHRLAHLLLYASMPPSAAAAVRNTGVVLSSPVNT